MLKVTPRLTQSLLFSFLPNPHWAGYSHLTWAVATQHPRLNQGCRHGDLVKQATVIIAGFLPRACDEDLHPSLQRREKRWSSFPQGCSRQALMGRAEGCWLHMQIPRLYFTIPKSPDF